MRWRWRKLAQTSSSSSGREGKCVCVYFSLSFKGLFARDTLIALFPSTPVDLQNILIFANSLSLNWVLTIIRGNGQRNGPSFIIILTFRLIYQCLHAHIGARDISVCRYTLTLSSVAMPTLTRSFRIVGGFSFAHNNYHIARSLSSSTPYFPFLLRCDFGCEKRIWQKKIVKFSSSLFLTATTTTTTDDDDANKGESTVKTFLWLEAPPMESEREE
jgi:hypothetical protein